MQTNYPQAWILLLSSAAPALANRHRLPAVFLVQAFLGVLTLLQKGSPLVLVQQYGEMYRQLAADDYASWQDYLLDQVSCCV